jgi:hypothetical protein
LYHSLGKLAAIINSAHHQRLRIHRAARSFGPFFVDQMFGVSMRWGIYLLVYLIGPLIGSSVAALLYVLIVQPGKYAEVELISGSPGAFCRRAKQEFAGLLDEGSGHFQLGLGFSGGYNPPLKPRPS